ncbi:hypothetical protein Ahy_B01g054293 isoform C [Arachis hypogaea]|uniref:RecA-like N-terminal domain-containing protein n=1 Tax=Arachis hypogaea TaxID=3818 RepID=A0A445ATN5_ARAHY|nr:hypothetical protein Ahy_B01g054293 isoform C [Arachis hypogaea]
MIRIPAFDKLGNAGGALVETCPSGCLTLDCALGGGLPKGRIAEFDNMMNLLTFTTTALPNPKSRASHQHQNTFTMCPAPPVKKHKPFLTLIFFSFSISSVPSSPRCTTSTPRLWYVMPSPQLCCVAPPPRRAPLLLFPPLLSCAPRRAPLLLVPPQLHPSLLDSISIITIGTGDLCSNHGVKMFTEELNSFSGVKGYCDYACITLAMGHGIHGFCLDRAGGMLIFVDYVFLVHIRRFSYYLIIFQFSNHKMLPRLSYYNVPNFSLSSFLFFPNILIETFLSGCLTLDCALGGNLPKGRIVEIFGPESSGKTTVALHAIAEESHLYVYENQVLNACKNKLRSMDEVRSLVSLRALILKVDNLEFERKSSKKKKKTVDDFKKEVRVTDEENTDHNKKSTKKKLKNDDKPTDKKLALQENVIRIEKKHKKKQKNEKQSELDTINKIYFLFLKFDKNFKNT